MADHGYYPYEEAQAKAKMRMSTVQRIGQLLMGGAQGFAASNENANPLESLFSGFGGGYAGSMASQNAAREYAAKQQEAEQAQQHRILQEAFMKAQIESMKKPEKVPGKQQDYQHLIDLGLSPVEARQVVYGPTMGEQATQKAEGPSGEIPKLSDEALDAAALRYSITGMMPSMGMGKNAAAYRAEVMNRGGKKYPAANIAANAAEYKKDSASLANTQKIADAATSWEDTVNLNSNVMMQYINQIPDTGTRFGNRVSRYLASQMGSPAQAAFNSARETIKVEYARLLSSPGIGNSVLSDASRREIEGILGGDMTAPQMKHALLVLRQDAKNRLSAYNKRVSEIQARLRSNTIGAVSSQPQGNQGGQDWIYDPETQELVPAQ